MKELFEFYLAKEGLPNAENLRPNQPYLVSSMFTCMCLWYALLYATCEGIEEEGKLDIKTIAPKYDVARGVLRRFRNAMFHVQPEYWTNKITDILHDSELPTTIREIHQQLGDWLKIEFKPFEEMEK